MICDIIYFYFSVYNIYIYNNNDFPCIALLCFRIDQYFRSTTFRMPSPLRKGGKGAKGELEEALEPLSAAPLDGWSVELVLWFIYKLNIFTVIIYIYTSGVYIHSHPPKNETIRPDWNCNNLLFWHLFWWLCLHYVLNLFMVCVVDWWVDSEVDRVDKQQTHMEILLDGHLSSRPFEREPRKWRWMSAPN